MLKGARECSTAPILLTAFGAVGRAPGGQTSFAKIEGKLRIGMLPGHAMAVVGDRRATMKSLCLGWGRVPCTSLRNTLKAMLQSAASRCRANFRNTSLPKKGG